MSSHLDPKPQPAQSQVAFTVFTATYNRAHTLVRVYESLRAQTFRDFEWILVDDGSTDDTAELVAGWLAEADFPMRFFQQANGGKHVAFNRGVREAQGALFLNLDSDDSCIPTALERFWHHWQAIPADERADFSGVTVLCRDEQGEVMGTPFPEEVVDASWLDMRFRNRIRGEKWGFQRTDVVRAFPFPEEMKMAAYPEDAIWDTIARHYKTRFVNEALRVYHTSSSSIAHNVDPLRHALRSREEAAHNVNNNADYFRYAPTALLKSAANYSRFCFHTGVGFAEQPARIAHGSGRLMWFVTLPVGFAAYRRDCARHR